MYHAAQSRVSTIQSVVLTADVFQLFIKYSYVRVLVTTAHRWRSSKKKHSAAVREKTNPTTGTTFFNFEDKVGVPRGHDENCCRFATLQREHQRLDRRVVDFFIRGDAGVMAELRNFARTYVKKTAVKVLPVVDLSAE